jgi:hypothetical protein
MSAADNASQSWRTFKPDVDKKPFGWLQWKGTAACMDFHCVCGAHLHFDEDFLYFVGCEHCGRRYELSGFIEVREMAPGERSDDNVKIGRDLAKEIEK